MESLAQEKERIRNMLAEVHEQLIEKENTQRDLDGAIQTFKNLTSEDERLAKELDQIGMEERQAE